MGMADKLFSEPVEKSGARRFFLLLFPLLRLFLFIGLLFRRPGPHRHCFLHFPLGPGFIGSGFLYFLVMFVIECRQFRAQQLAALVFAGSKLAQALNKVFFHDLDIHLVHYIPGIERVYEQPVRISPRWPGPVKR